MSRSVFVRSVSLICATLVLANFSSACRRRGAGSEMKENWYPTDEPEIFQGANSKVIRFADMDLRGGVKGASFDRDQLILGTIDDKKFWNGSYWPLSRGGVANRWRSGGQIAPANATFDPSRPGDLDRLSPIEKYDLIAGNFDFRATNAELAHYGQKTWNGWEGYCHGWSSATIYDGAPTYAFTYPVKGNPQLQIRLYPDDVRAMLTKFWGDHIALTSNGSGRLSTEIGMQCQLRYDQLQSNSDPVLGETLRDARTGRLNDLHCRDINPGSFHVILDAFLGQSRLADSRRAFIMDMSATDQIWNYPVVGYSARQIVPSGMSQSESAAIRNLIAGNLKDNVGCKKRNELDKAGGMDRYRGDAGKGVACIVDLETTVYYLSLTTPQDSVPAPSISHLVLNYSVELSEEGYITGGEWDHSKGSASAPDVQRPDVLWIPKVVRRTNADGSYSMDSAGNSIDYSVLQEILRAGQ